MKYLQDSVLPATQMTERECKLCPFAHEPRTCVNGVPASLQKELSSSFLDMPTKQHYSFFIVL